MPTIELKTHRMYGYQLFLGCKIPAAHLCQSPGPSQLICKCVITINPSRMQLKQKSQNKYHAKNNICHQGMEHIADILNGIFTLLTHQCRSIFAIKSQNYSDNFSSTEF
jgi:hypothetical protein